MVVFEAASPLGTLGAAAQVWLVLLELPPHEGSMNRADSTRHSISNPRNFLRPALAEANGIPSSEIPTTGSQIAGVPRLRRTTLPLPEVDVLMFKVVVAPPLVGVTEAFVKLQVGSGVSVPVTDTAVTLQVRLTAEL